MLVAAFVLLCLFVQGEARTVTARPDYCVKKLRSSRRLAKLVTRRPGLFFRSSRVQCWHPRPPQEGDDVVVDFSRSTLAADGRFFTFDEPQKFRSLTVRGARWRRRRNLPLHSVVRIKNKLEVKHTVHVPQYGLLYLAGKHAGLKAGRVLLDRATLLGSGRIEADEFITTKGSHIAPGRMLVSRCGARCYALPRPLGGTQYGNLTLITHTEADLTGATLVIKHIGEHPSFNAGSHDIFEASKATPVAGAVLVLGDKRVKIPASADRTNGPYGLVQFPAAAFPKDPSAAICIAGGSGALDYSSTSDRCRRFVLRHAELSVFRHLPAVDVRQRWASFVDVFRTLAASQNVVPFQVANCCKQLIHRSFVSRRILRRVSRHRALMTRLGQKTFLHQMHVDMKLRALAPVEVRDQAKAIVPTTSPAPVLPNALKVTKSCFFCFPAPVAQPVTTHCVASTSVLVTPSCCPPGFRGANCESPLLCHCSSHGTCEEESGSCMCDPGFEGFDCSIPACPSSQGLQCTGPAFGKCNATANDPTSISSCTCSPGFTGDACEIPVCSPPCGGGSRCFTNGGAPICWENDPLSVTRCENGGTLTPDAGCQCPPTFEGPRCQSPLCPKRCSKSGMCKVNAAGEPYCECQKGFSGKDCSKTKCYDGKCQNGGVCVYRAGLAECACPQPWGGEECAERIVISARGQIFASSALSDGAILGIIILCSLVVAAVLVFFIIMWRKRSAARMEREIRKHDKKRLQKESGHLSWNKNNNNSY